MSQEGKLKYKYYCVVDFEATCWESPNNDNLKKPHEIIEFPSVLLKLNDNNTLVKISEFQKYCKPQVNPQLSDFCTSLTGITQETVDKANIFPIVMKEHFEWLLKETDGAINDVIFCSCGIWDFQTALRNELKRWGAHYDLYMKHPELYEFCVKKAPAIYSQYFNVKDPYTSIYGIKAGGMVTMLKTLDIKLEGRHHSGLDDSKNIGKILQECFVKAKENVYQHIPIRETLYKITDNRVMWKHTKKPVSYSDLK